MSHPRRFIAGAVCPRCNARDTVVMFKRDDKTYRACVDCGFEDELRITAPVREPVTRATRNDVAAQPVRLLGAAPPPAASDKARSIGGAQQVEPKPPRAKGPETPDDAN